MKAAEVDIKKLPDGWELVEGRPMQTRITTYPPIIIGKDPYSKNLLASYGQTYLMLAAPPGSGKDVGIVTPNLLVYPHSIVINDVKFESWHLTAGFRAACGQKISRFSPGTLETHYWNPFRMLNLEPLFRLGQLREMAGSLYVPDNEKNASWFNQAANVFVALCLYVIESEGEYMLTLPQINEFASLGVQLGSWAQKVIDERDQQGRPLSDETRRELTTIVSSSKGREFSTLMDFVTNRLKIYGEKTVALALTESKNPAHNIDFSKMRETPTTVYFCVTESEMKKFAPLMNLFYSQAIRANSKVIPEHGGHCEDGSLKLKYQVLFLMNEFAIMKRMEVMETAPALTRGAGLRYAIIFQSENQLKANDCYGEAGGAALLSTFHVNVVFAPAPTDEAMAKAYSVRLGNKTVKVPSDNHNVSDGQRRSRGRSFSLQQRPLLLPQEISELPYKEELIFIQATDKHPAAKIRARKIMWYKEKLLKQRTDKKKYPAPSVPVGDAERLKEILKPVRIPKTVVTLARPQGDDIRLEEKRRIKADVPDITDSNN